MPSTFAEMSIKWYLFFCFLIQLLESNAQKHDYNWILGTSHPKGDLLNFDNYSLSISPIDKTIPFYATNSCMSSTEGNLTFSFNGLQIQNPQHLLMDNTDSLQLGNAAILWSDLGASTNQGSLALPMSGQNNKYRLFYWDNKSFDLAPDTPYTSPRNLYMAIIDMNMNGGEGKVIEKNLLVLSDTFANGGIDAVKHANGRDWWVIIPKMTSNRYHTLLVSPYGIDTAFVQASGVWWPPFADLTTQSCFSNDGLKFIRFSDEVGLQIFDFNRCSGLFNNPNLVPFEFNDGYFCGASISNNSRFAYVTDTRRAWQYDLTAADVASTKTLIAEFDGFQNPYNCNFHIAQLAPDGKIYLNTWGGCKNLHVIEHPDRPGTACEFRQHGISLFTYTEVGLPNMPNFRLGPMDGSKCDSLGIDNIPVAAFRHDSDSMTVEFTDLSYYEPSAWFWNFGDGTTSAQRYPSHTYQATGQYSVCLTVSNEYGTNTYCRVVLIGTSGTSEQTLERIELFPNPSTEQLQVALPNDWHGTIRVTLSNSLGQVMNTENLEATDGLITIALGSLPNGLYVCQIATTGKKSLSGLFEVIR